MFCLCSRLFSSLEGKFLAHLGELLTAALANQVSVCLPVRIFLYIGLSVRMSDVKYQHNNERERVCMSVCMSVCV